MNARPSAPSRGVGRKTAVSAAPLLEVRGLRVAFATPGGPVRAVDGVSFELAAGETLAIVGESGSGKSVCALSLMGLTRGPRTTIEGEALLEGEQLTGASERRLRAIRGARMAMVFQDPQSSLNPVQRVGSQIAEQILAHRPATGRRAALARAAELLERVGVPAARARSYPHELSGGMRQRAMIAMALSLGAPVLLADEPTTALDVTVQAQILGLLKRLQEEERMGIVLITHDFAVVAGVADRVLVMRAGQIVEQGSTDELLSRPEHPYTRQLLRALSSPARARKTRSAGHAPHTSASPTPSLPGAQDRPTPPVSGSVPDRPTPPLSEAAPHRPDPAAPLGDSAPLVEVEDLRVTFGPRYARLVALDGVSLDVREGETVAVVGESGSGKTTLIRAIARLIVPDSGRIRFAGADVTTARGRRLAPLRESLGMVFQDPAASLNPRRRVGATVELVLRARGVGRAEAQSRTDVPGCAGAPARTRGLSRAEAQSRALELLQRVGLGVEHAGRYPHELSGGERQRVGIARALAGEPRLVLLDEPVSSLDASLRRGAIELLAELQEQVGCAYVLVSHDLAMVAGVADRIAVMCRGELVELGDAGQVLHSPRHPYTRELLAARPPEPPATRGSEPLGARGLQAPADPRGLA